MDQELCTGCGLCVTICAAQILQKTEAGIGVDPDRATPCLQCGHCMAMCPAEAIRAPGYTYEQFAEVPDTTLAREGFADLLLARRSVRTFQDRPVEREVLERLLQLAATAPYGWPDLPVEVTVLDTRAKVAALVAMMVPFYERSCRQLRGGLTRFLIRRSMGAELFDALDRLMVPFVLEACAAYRKDGRDYFTWEAPALLIFHVHRAHASARDDCAIACTYALLAAHALGLGATMLGVVPEAVEHSKEMRARLEIPVRHQVLSSAIVGYPKHRFRRTIPRRFGAVTWPS